MDERIKKLAHNLIHYSCEVKPKERVMIHVFGSSAQDFAHKTEYTTPGSRRISKDFYRK